jgi:hypothetical protein
MRNDSIDTMLLRHYGRSAPAPVNLEARLTASVRQAVAETSEREKVAAAWGERPISRRRVLRLVTLSGVGVGVLSVGLEGLRHIEASLIGQDANRPVYT